MGPEDCWGAWAPSCSSLVSCFSLGFQYLDRTLGETHAKQFSIAAVHWGVLELNQEMNQSCWWQLLLRMGPTTIIQMAIRMSTIKVQKNCKIRSTLELFHAGSALDVDGSENRR